MISKVRLIKRITGFVAGFVLILIAIDLLSFTDIGDDILGRVFFATGYRNIGSWEICPAIEKAGEEGDYTKLVLGDSVCHQIFYKFGNMNTDYLLLGTNQAVTMDGQYILARLFMDNHENVSDIYLVMLPVTFSSGYDSIQSYSYLIEPFGGKDKLEYLSEETRFGMQSLYGNVFLDKNVIKLIDGSCINNKIYLYYNQNKINEYKKENLSIISPESEYYIRDIDRICKDRNIKFHILCAPMGDTDTNHENINELKKCVKERELEMYFADYFESVNFLPKEMFADGTHFGGEFANIETYRECVCWLSEKTGSLEGLVY